MALKLPKFIRFSFQTNDFLQYLTCRWSPSNMIMSYRFLCVELAGASLKSMCLGIEQCLRKTQRIDFIRSQLRPLSEKYNDHH